jgi:SIR2-like domain
MPLDPIVSLSVAIAEGPGSYAFFLGSGVSRDAGVPSGIEVYWQAIGELYRLELGTEETPDQDVLAEWLRENDRQELGYAGVLELLTPDQATRREYLAKNFDGVEPAETHQRLADLAARRLIRVFITTNFDRLLEHSLQSEGIEPVVITSDADLQRAPSREHTPCYVLKPHGDYLQQTIRNTPAELAQLEPAMTAELQEVFNRYGLVVLGYSGSDEAIAAIFRARRSRYGLYWVSRGELTEPARSLVEAGAGRLIVRASAEEFLADLDLRLKVFEAQPSGLTPVAVNDQVVGLLSTGEQVRLAELLRRERLEFEQRVEDIIAAHRQQQPTVGLAGEIYDELLPVLERRLGTPLPLVLYDEELFAEEVNALADFKSRQPVHSGLSFFPELLDWCVWWLGYVAGAFAVRMRRFAVLGPLFAAEITTRYQSGVVPLVSPWTGSAGEGIGKAVTARHSEQRWLDPAWQALLEEASHLQLLTECYPELVRTEDEFKRALVEYDLVFTASMALLGRRTFARWSMYGELAYAFALRLKADQKMRTAIADVIGISLDDFDQRVAAALEPIHKLGQFPQTEAIAALRPDPES